MWGYPLFSERRRVLALLAIGFLCWNGLGHRIEAQLVDLPAHVDPLTGQQIKLLLETHWPRGLENEKRSKEIFASWKSPSDPSSLAYIVNRIHHSKPREAIVVAQGLVGRTPDSIDGWMMRAWLDALVDDYERSLVDLRSLKGAIKAHPLLGDSQKESLYGRMGKLIGYMQGPVHKKVDPDLLQSTIMVIADGLPPKLLKVFNAHQKTVLDRYEKRVAAQTKKETVELEDQKVKDAQMMALLTQQNLDQQQALEQRVAQRALVVSEGNQRIALLTSQLGPLESELGAVSNRLGAVQYDLQAYYADLYNAQQGGPGNYYSIHFIEDQIRSLEYERAILQSRRLTLFNRLRSVQVQLAQQQAQIRGLLSGVDQQIQTMRRTIRRNENRLAKLAGGTKLTPEKRVAMQQRLEAFRSYTPLSDELARQQLLDLK